MFFIVLIFVTCITQIFGRPTTEDNKIQKNVFLLPTIWNSNDMINITINISEYPPEEIIVSLMGDDKNSTNIICSIRADIMNSRTVTIRNERDELVVEEEIDHFFLDADKMLFNMWLKRRENEETEENNVLEVNTKSFALKPFIVDNINKIRYLKFSGKNAKMINLEFEYA